LIAERAVSSPSPARDGSRFTSSNPRSAGDDLRMTGINSARGALAESLGDLLIYDADGSRTAAVVPLLSQLANDPVLAVRTCVAHLLAAALRHARPAAVEAFRQLVNADDDVLAADTVRNLIVYIGNEQPDAVRPLIERMLHSAIPDVREAGGELAAFAALEWDFTELLELGLTHDPACRKGIAHMCAQRLARTSNADLAGATLKAMFVDADDAVRDAAANVALALRGRALQQFESVLTALIVSPAYANATPQLFITLEQAQDRVDELVRLCAQRFIDVFGSDASDIRTAAAGDARHVSDLLIRALAQSREPAERARVLDLLDDMVKIGAYGVDEAIDAAER